MPQPGSYTLGLLFQGHSGRSALRTCVPWWSNDADDDGCISISLLPPGAAPATAAARHREKSILTHTYTHTRIWTFPTTLVTKPSNARAVCVRRARELSETRRKDTYISRGEKANLKENNNKTRRRTAPRVWGVHCQLGHCRRLGPSPPYINIRGRREYTLKHTRTRTKREYKRKKKTKIRK